MVMVLQERDKEILRWVNGYGFVTVNQIKRWMGVGETAGYVRVRKLVEGGYLKRKRVFHNQERVHWISNQAQGLIQDDIKNPKRVNISTYYHDLLLVDLGLYLEKTGGVEFIPERRLRNFNTDNTVIGKKGRIPDAILIQENNQKPIAIELELSVKSKDRLRKIINDYMVNFNYDAVWYFTNNQAVYNALSKFITPSSPIKIYQFQLINKEIQI